MKTLLTLILIPALALNALAQDITLKYNWKPGASYRYKCVQKDEVKMDGSLGGGPGNGLMPEMAGMGGMMSMAGNMTYNTNTTFTMKILSVQPDGDASGMFFIESFKVSDGSGKAYASLAGIPKQALKAPFTVDAQGNFTFTQLPVLIVGENRTILTIVQVDGSEPACGEEAGEGESVKVYAEFTKGGGLKAGFTVTTVGKPKPKAIAIGEDDEVIDLIPTDFLDMLALPDGAVKEGQAEEMSGGMYEGQFKVASLKGDMAVLTHHIGARMSSTEMKQVGDESSKSLGMGEADDDEVVPRIAQESVADVTVNFDRASGMFKSLSGKATNKQDMMGMQVHHKSTFSMTPVQ